MPILNFLLTNPEPELETKKDSEEWTLRFDATIKRPEGLLNRFKIFCGGEELDGYSSKGNAIITQQTSENESQQSPLHERPGHIYLHYFPPGDELRNSEGLSTAFTIYIRLPADTFLRVLQMNPEKHLIHLGVDTGIENWREEGLAYGDDPDGKEIEWRVEKKNYAHADSIRLTIEPPPVQTDRVGLK